MGHEFVRSQPNSEEIIGANAFDRENIDHKDASSSRLNIRTKPDNDDLVDGSLLLENALKADLRPNVKQALERQKGKRDAQKRELHDAINSIEPFPLDESVGQETVDDHMILDSRDYKHPPQIQEIDDTDIVESETLLNDEDIEDIEDLTDFAEQETEKIEDMTQYAYPEDLRQLDAAIDNIKDLLITPREEEENKMIEVPTIRPQTSAPTPKPPSSSNKLGRWVRNAALFLGGLFATSRGPEQISDQPSKPEVSSQAQQVHNRYETSSPSTQVHFENFPSSSSHSTQGKEKIFFPQKEAPKKNTQTREERVYASLQKSIENDKSKLSPYDVIYFDTDPNLVNLLRSDSFEKDQNKIAFFNPDTNQSYNVSEKGKRLTQFLPDGKIDEIRISHKGHRTKDFQAFKDNKATLADQTLKFTYNDFGDLSRVIVKTDRGIKTFQSQKELAPFVHLNEIRQTSHTMRTSREEQRALKESFQGAEYSLDSTEETTPPNENTSLAKK